MVKGHNHHQPRKVNWVNLWLFNPLKKIKKNYLHLLNNLKYVLNMSQFFLIDASNILRNRAFESSVHLTMSYKFIREFLITFFFFVLFKFSHFFKIALSSAKQNIFFSLELQLMLRGKTWKCCQKMVFLFPSY